MTKTLCWLTGFFFLFIRKYHHNVVFHKGEIYGLQHHWSLLQIFLWTLFLSSRNESILLFPPSPQTVLNYSTFCSWDISNEQHKTYTNVDESKNSPRQAQLQSLGARAEKQDAAAWHISQSCNPESMHCTWQCPEGFSYPSSPWIYLRGTTIPYTTFCKLCCIIKPWRDTTNMTLN